VPRSFGLWNSQCIDKLANAPLAATQQAENSQAGRIGNGPKNAICGIEGLGFHIRLCKYRPSLLNRQGALSKSAIEAVRTFCREFTMRIVWPVLCLAIAYTVSLAKAEAKSISMRDQISRYLAEREQEFDQISAERKDLLGKVADYVKDCRRQDRPARLVFICTQNSRRSHLGQIWGAAAAAYCGVPKVATYSGGTQSSAFNPRAVAALERAGFDVQKTTDDENPIYHVRFSDGGPIVTSFSKVFSDAPNPKKDFCAVMVCSSADEACPIVAGAAERVAVPFEDPKVADGSADEAKTYDERSRQIAREMLYVMSVAKGAKL
jgi:arsenate reductase